jgi:hypothetical protein
MKEECTFELGSYLWEFGLDWLEEEELSVSTAA